MRPNVSRWTKTNYRKYLVFVVVFFVSAARFLALLSSRAYATDEFRQLCCINSSIHKMMQIIRLYGWHVYTINQLITRLNNITNRVSHYSSSV